MRTLNERELRTLVDLLDDEDPNSLGLVHRQLLGVGKAALPYLEEAHDRLGPRLRDRLDAVISELRQQDLSRAFAELAGERDPDLERGALLLCRFGYPLLDPGPYTHWLDKTVAQLPCAGSPKDFYPALLRLNQELFGRLGFQGNRTRYYDPDNSFLHRVIDSRRGIPISLSVLYLLLGRRLDIPLQGAGIPGHFMVRFDLGFKTYLLDPFRGGQILTRSQCRAFLLRNGYPFREEFLEPASNRDILVRMIRNLLSLHQRSGHTEAAQRLSDLVALLLTAPSTR